MRQKNEIEHDVSPISRDFFNKIIPLRIREVQITVSNYTEQLLHPFNLLGKFHLILSLKKGGLFTDTKF